ncbi:2Fe-2S iron-sulfur cluster-binding protein [Microbacterium sp. No. 7]|uniref:2Fe-2S iron-sulfur cluster-binding protein n=1 Tax=Microbacterium sp. No. 7 TaxID=1714373 RepID=UPI0006D040B4|nr:2Fe-2S iron-sulfur cluster-binding protein [Microbacterium sp. No. 7]ALJ18890.1 hypothetical protein AOA12_02780 [Microbacterium sp. No. 7]
MTRVEFVQPDGEPVVVEGDVGQTVMSVAIGNAVPGIVGECGGQLSCSTCHVFVDESCRELFGEPDEFEDEMLDGTAAPREEGSRLSCQMVVGEAPVVVRVPETQY